MKPSSAAVLAGALLVAGCGGTSTETAGEDPVASVALADHAFAGAILFDKATFGGNGRTCRSCHDNPTGALSPEAAQKRFAHDPSDPLFRAIDSDDGTGASYDRLLQYATVFVTIPLPPYVKLADDPAAQSVTLERSVPTFLDKNPAIESTLMWDGRAPTLQAQALGAIHGHAQSTVEPAQAQLDAIAAFEDTQFSSDRLEDYAEGGPPPELPKGHTPSEKRGRAFFEDVPFDLAATGMKGVCSVCHSGPMLNVTKDFRGLQPIGVRFSTAFVSELDDRNLPPRTYLFDLPGVGQVPVSTTDPGIALQAQNPIINNNPFAAIGAVGVFKIPTLWGVKHTAPYFHDNSAPTLEAVVDHYNRMFTLPLFGLPPLSAQDQADIVAFMKLL
jgi:cytochrome c peroxidase